MEIINHAIADKFCGLLQFLKKYQATFETVADEVEDCNLKTALNGLSAESIQFANEICNQLKTFGLPYRLDTNVSPENDEENYFYLYESPTPGMGNELMSLCNSSEKSIISAYTDILNEYLPMNNLRNIMLYQLNALKLAFMRIKLLNDARFLPN